MVNDSNRPNSKPSSNTEQLRNSLYTRNLYTPDAQYPLQNDSVIDKTVGVISTIINGITPFKSINLEDSAFGRAITIDNQSPLSIIGLTMLGKQMALNSMSSIAQKNFPIINVSNILDKNPNSKFITRQIDYNITIKSGSTKIGNFLRSAVSFYPQFANPFASNDITSSEYIKNTGLGQLDKMYSLINLNLYRPDSKSNETFYEYSKKAHSNIVQTNKNISKKNVSKKYFTFDIKMFYPYGVLGVNDNSISDANNGMINSLKSTKSIEYASDNDYIKSFGRTNKFDNKMSLTKQNSWIGSTNSPTNDNTIVWGRDGVNAKTIVSINQYRGTFNDVNYKYNNDTDNILKAEYDVNGGLLEYTRNLLKARKGFVIDLTKKAFLDNIDDRKIGFNGSGLWMSNNSEYARKSEIAKKTGTRQHSAIDQYDRFAKAIRFNGNSVYDGNPNSVIYNTVLPQIHPSFDNEKRLINKNLMFSIENLAVKVIGSDGVGIIDDEYGSEIPQSEVGPFNGRIMWFPPYGMEVQETAIAKYESTVMVGRSEPMYNYQNSERTANLSFILLIDYPPQVRNYTKSNSSSQREIAEFFAFGGDKITNEKYIKNLELSIKLLQKEKNKINDSLSTEISKNKLISELDLEIANLQRQLNFSEKGIIGVNDQSVMNYRNKSETGILHGFQSIENNYFYPAFHSQTPEDFHKRLTFLQQCTRQGSSKKYSVKPDSDGILRARNSVFGRQPICILRIGDFFYCKVIIENINIDYTDTTWDMNPEGFGMQPMIAKVQMQMKVIGGQSLKGPIDALQNAVSYNYYANSNYTSEGRYYLPAAMASYQDSFNNGVNDNSAIINKFTKRNKEFIEKL